MNSTTLEGEGLRLCGGTRSKAANDPSVLHKTHDTSLIEA